MPTLRDQLVEVSLQWQKRYGVAPHITTAISEYDAALLVGMSEPEYSAATQSQTAVTKGYDFVYNGIRYQVKANRPSGKPGSRVTLVAKAKNYDWDYLVWLLYDPVYRLQEAWLWDVAAYRARFDDIKRLSPGHYREGRRLYPPGDLPNTHPDKAGR